MPGPHTPVQSLAFMVLVAVTIGQCQENQRELSPFLRPSSRRAVTEHQLMHDRGRTMQSLKRLIWLSNAMEGVHTAQTRSSLRPPSPALDQGPAPDLAPLPPGSQSAGLNSAHQRAMESRLRNYFNLQLSALPEGEP